MAACLSSLKNLIFLLLFRQFKAPTENLPENVTLRMSNIGLVTPDSFFKTNGMPLA